MLVNHDRSTSRDFVVIFSKKKKDKISFADALQGWPTGQRPWPKFLIVLP